MSIIPTLRDSAMLVNVSISVWSARKLDRKQTTKAIKGAKATSDAARVNKNLLASADAQLREVHRKAKAIRNFVDDNSVPWDNAGNRLVTNDRALTLVGELKQLQDEFAAAVDAFVDEYPILRAQAVSNLGDMGDDSDYPQAEVVRRKFGVEIEFQPIAQNFSDVRIGLSETQAKAFQQHFEGNVQKQMANAVRAAWGRLQENLQRYSQNLDLRDDDSGKMKIFRDSMVTQLRDTISLLRGLGNFGDDNMAAIVARLEKDVAAFEAGQLRSSPATSVGVKAQVDDILKKMRGFLDQ
jgi:hypothetical protein